MIDTGLYIGYGLFLGTLLVAVVLPLVSAMKSPKDLTRIAVAAALLGGLYLVSFLLSGSEVTAEYIAQGVDEGASKRIGSGLIMFYIVFGGALLGVVSSEINKLLK